MSYATVDYAIKTLGRGALLANFDITNAYRVILVHPTDRLLLGLPLRGDTLWTEHFISVSGRRRTASRQWLMPQSEGGMSFMPCTIWTISLYFAPLTPRNVAGRCRRLSRASWRDPRLSFLGILIDSENDMLSFPADKCARLRSAISESRDRKFCRKRELLSLMATPVRPGGDAHFGRLREMGCGAFTDGGEWFQFPQWEGVHINSSLSRQRVPYGEACGRDAQFALSVRQRLETRV